MSTAAATTAAATTVSPPRLEPHLVVETIGDLTTAITSRPVTLAQGLDGEDVITMPEGTDFLLLADTVTIQGPCTAPGRNVTIVARQIATAGTDAAIVVDGAPGVDGNAGDTKAPLQQTPAAGDGKPGWQGNPGGPGTAGAAGQAGGTPGTEGKQAGTISIYVNEAVTGLNLRLSAVGGKGGDGQDGQQGQDGGTGGPGWTEDNDWRGDPGTAGGPGGQGGYGGNGGAAGAGGKGGKIVWNVVARDPSIPRFDARVGCPGIPGKAGQSGAPGNGGPGGSGYAGDSSLGVRETWPGGPKGNNSGGDVLGIHIPAVPDASDGAAVPGTATVASIVELDDDDAKIKVASASDAPGFPQAPFRAVLVAPKASDGAAPPDQVVDVQGFDGVGTFTVTTVVPAATKPTEGWLFLVDADSAVESLNTVTDYKFAALVDPGYLRMQRDRARFVYLSIDPAAIDGKKIWTDDATAADVPSPIQEALARIEWALAIIDAKTAGQKPEDVQPFVPIWSSLDAMHRSLLKGLDYFGHPPEWVPKARFEYYLGLLDGVNDEDGVIADLADAEANAADYRAKALANLQDKAYLEDLVSRAADAQTALQQVKSDALEATGDLGPKIEDESDTVTAKRAALDTKLSAAKKGFEQGASSFGGLTWEKVFDAVTQIAFLPENPFGTGLNAVKSISLLGPQVGKLGGALADDAQVTDDDGQPLPTAWVVNSITAVGDSVDQLAESFQTLPDGTLSADDPDLKMLLSSKSALDQLVQRFYSTSSELHQASDAMDDYVAAVVARNGTILQYNAELVRYRQAWAQYNAAKTAQTNATDLQAATTTLGLADAGHLIDSYLDQAREDCIETLYLTSRAYSMWALEPDDTFHADLQLDNAWDFDSDLAKSVRADTVTKHKAEIEQRWIANPVPPPFRPTDDMARNGLVWKLQPADWPDLFRGLRNPKKGAGFVVLPPSRSQQPRGPFPHMMNVRLRGVRCWLHGVKSSSGLVWVRLTHGGDETFVDPSKPKKTDPPDAKDVHLRHDPIRIDFRYRAATDADVGNWRSVEGQPNTVDGILTDPDGVYVAIGPFATWKVELLDVTQPATDGKGPKTDASGLIRIDFEFFVFMDGPE